MFRVALVALLAVAAGDGYRSVAIDGKALRIVLDSGKAIPAPRVRGQTSFDSPAISPDHRTAGWLAMCPDPGVTYYQGAELPFELVLYRGGRILHQFTTEQVFWDWGFRDSGKRVAYCTGPTHGGAAECLLRDVDTGKTMGRWYARGEESPPNWVESPRH